MAGVTAELEHVSIRAARQPAACGRETAAMPDDLDVLDLADKLFTGALPIESHHPFASSGKLAEVQPRVAFVDAFANSAVVDTDDGLVVVDTSGVFHAKARARDDPALVAAPARHRDLHARPHRPRVRRRPLRGGGAHQRVGAAARDRARGDRARGSSATG